MGEELDSGSNGRVNWKKNVDYELIVDGTGELGNIALPSDVEVLTINEGITSIADSCFNSHDNLKEVYIPNTVKTIRDAAFCFCKNLEKVIMKDGVESIGMNAFTFCPKL